MPWGALYSCSSGSRCPACRVPTRQDLAHTAGGNSVDLYHSDAVVNNHCYANTTMGTHRGHSETPPAASRRDVPGLWRQPFPASVARPADARGWRRQRSEATLERRRSRRGRPNCQSWSSQQHPRKFSHQRSARGGRAKQLRLTGEFSPTNIRSGPVLPRHFLRPHLTGAPRFLRSMVTLDCLNPLWCAWELVGTSPSPALLHRCARSPTQRRRKQVPLVLPPRHVAAATPLPNPRPSARTDCSSARVQALSPPPSSSAAPLHASITPIPATTAGVFGAAESRV